MEAKKSIRVIQHFSDDYLKSCQKMRPKEVLKFLDDFRKLHARQPSVSKSKLISLKVPQDLLDLFKQKANLHNTPYQTQIKKLMSDWLKR